MSFRHFFSVNSLHTLNLLRVCVWCAGKTQVQLIAFISEGAGVLHTGPLGYLMEHASLIMKAQIH